MTRARTTTAFMTMKPLRLRVFGFVDIVLVSDAEQIQWLNQQPSLTRPIDGSLSFLHRYLERRMREELGFEGKPLPVFRARQDAERAAGQSRLRERLDALRGAPGDERDRIAQYVSGDKDVPEIGVLVQQWCGRLFSKRFESSHELYEAGRLLAGWGGAPPWQTYWDRARGKLHRAKALLSAACGGDLHCAHATSIGMENIARTVRKLRKAAQHADKQQLSSDQILRECLVAPPALLRGCSGELDVPFLAEPLTQRSLIVFLVARAYATSGSLDVAFLSGSWSECPARRVVPDMLRGVWQAAQNDGVEVDRLIATLNSWSRLWHRAAS